MILDCPWHEGMQGLNLTVAGLKKMSKVRPQRLDENYEEVVEESPSLVVLRSSWYPQGQDVVAPQGWLEGLLLHELTDEKALVTLEARPGLGLWWRQEV